MARDNGKKRSFLEKVLLFFRLLLGIPLLLSGLLFVCFTIAQGSFAVAVIGACIFCLPGLLLIFGFKKRPKQLPQADTDTPVPATKTDSNARKISYNTERSSQLKTNTKQNTQNMTSEDAHRKAYLNNIIAQAQQKGLEHDAAISSTSLAPSTIARKELSYHYQDVEIVISWKYCGSYGKTVKSLGVKRGDTFELVFDHEEEDRDSVAVVWYGETVGHMRENRMRDMVRKWKRAKYPVFCAASHVGGESKLLLEFAFYGYISN